MPRCEIFSFQCAVGFRDVGLWILAFWVSESVLRWNRTKLVSD